MKCEQFKKNIDTYLEGELGDKESLEFEDHLTTCQQCQMELMSMDRCIKLMQKVMRDADPPDSIRKGVFKKLNCLDMMKMCCFPHKSDDK